MKIGFAQINTTVGNFASNVDKILSAIEVLANDGADFVVFPELTVSGLPMKDLSKYRKFVETAQEYLSIVIQKASLPVLLGCPSVDVESGLIYNSAYWIEQGAIKVVYDKMLLPNYGALNDPRIFEAGKEFCVINFNQKRLAITICEDIWTLPSVETSVRYKNSQRPLDTLIQLAKDDKPVDLLINMSASVFSDKNDTIRHKGGMLDKISEAIKAPIAWCNLVGGNDELIFAGASCYVDASKGICKSLSKFKEEICIVDTNSQLSHNGDNSDFNGIADLHDALVLSLKDFIEKIGIKKVMLGLSGGLDSAVVAALAVEALGKDRVIGVSMPSKISSEHSKDDAIALAKNLGIQFHMISIADVVASAESTLAPLFAGRPRDVAEENIQSRSRGLLLMAISNKFGALVLTTGNKSECAVGYCTLYGDTCGGFAPICDVYKTDVYKLANYINERASREIVPQNTIDKPPSAELRPDQKDEDSLPPYDLFDAILRLHIDEYKSVSEIVEMGFDRAVVEDVARKVAGAEYKRTQYPIGPKVTSVAYSTDRKIPVAIKRGMQ